MTDLMDAPVATVDKVDDGLGDRWEFEGFGVRMDVFPRPVSPGELRFSFPVRVAVVTKVGDELRLFRDGEIFHRGESDRDARVGHALTVDWTVHI